MKNLKQISIFLIAVLFLACNTNNEPSSNNNEITMDVSKTAHIKKQEPVVFMINNLAANAEVNWTVTPESDVELRTDRHVASALFFKSGDYVIKGISGGTEVSQTLQVIDSVYIPPISDPTVVPLKENEKLKVTYTVNDSSASGKPDILLVLSFETTMKYPTKNNYLLTRESQPNHIVIDGVYVPEIKFQTDDSQVAYGGIVLFPEPGAKSNNITIEMDGVEYTGSYYIIDKELYVSWQHTDRIEFIGANLLEIELINNQ